MFISSVLFVESFLMMICALIDIYDKNISWIGFVYGSVAAMFVGVILTFIAYTRKRATRTYEIKKANAVFSIGWLASIPFGIIPFLINNPDINVSGAILEFTSAITTVGLTFYLRDPNISHGLLFWHTILAGIGGIGVIIISCIVMNDDEQFDSLSHLAKIEFGSEVNLRVSSSNKLAKNIILIYVTIMLLCILCYRLFGLSTWDAICTGITTVSTSGFVHYTDIHDLLTTNSLLAVATVFMVLGSIPMVLLAKSVFSFNFNILTRSEQVKWFMRLLALFSIFVIWKMFSQIHIFSISSIFISVFHVASAMTTTGFNDLSFFTGKFGINSVFGLLFLITVFGGCVGSTTGGVKMSRLLISVKGVKKLLLTRITPSKITVVRINNNPVKSRAVEDALLFIFLYVTTYIVVVCLILFLREPNLGEASSLALSLITTSGMRGSEVLNLSNNSNLSITQIVSSIVMIIGRLELISFYTLFSRRSWAFR